MLLRAFAREQLLEHSLAETDVRIDEDAPLLAVDFEEDVLAELDLLALALGAGNVVDFPSAVFPTLFAQQVPDVQIIPLLRRLGRPTEFDVQVGERFGIDHFPARGMPHDLCGGFLLAFLDDAIEAAILPLLRRAHKSLGIQLRPLAPAGTGPAAAARHRPPASPRTAAPRLCQSTTR